MKIPKSLMLALGQHPSPIVTRYHLGCILSRLFSSMSQAELDNFGGKKLTRKIFDDCLKQLLQQGVLAEHVDVSNVYTLLGRSENQADALVCALDPFAYLSHLSAMAYHGLTDRFPESLYVSSPSPKEWKAFAAERMRKELGVGYEKYQEAKLPLLTRMAMLMPK